MIAVGPVTILGVGVALVCGVGSLLANRRLHAGARYVAAHREHVVEGGRVGDSKRRVYG